MKKLFILFVFFASFTIAASAQGGGDPAAMAQRFKERIKPDLLTKTKITDAQAEKVLDIQLASRQQMRGFRDLSEDDRKKKNVEIQADIVKQYKAIPLTEEQIQVVNEFFEEQRKNQQQRQGGGNRNGN